MSYTPLMDAFEHLVNETFPEGLTQPQKDALQMFFFAGAACSVGDIKRNPAMKETIFDELVTMTDVYDRAASKVS